MASIVEDLPERNVRPSPLPFLSTSDVDKADCLRLLASVCVCLYCLRWSFFLWSALFQSVGTTRLATAERSPLISL